MATLNCKNQTVFIGDNREVMLGLNSGCVDLICADPPFNKEKRFDHVFGTPPKKGKQKPGFDDKWDGWLMTPQRAEELALLRKCHPRIYRLCQSALEMHSLGMQGYLVMMATRLLECRRLLKTTGSIYLHCDPTANAYLRLLLDGIFGNKNFLGEIIWSYRTGGASKRWFSKKHDTILAFAKNKGQHTFNLQKEKAYTKAVGRKPGKINYGAGTAEFFEDKIGVFNLVGMRSVWEISYLNSMSKERSGWATQKPIALYSRMILASSNPGDVVLDPFCGCATTLVAAENAGRKWIGIDRDPEAERQVILRTDIPQREDEEPIPHYRQHFDALYRAHRMALATYANITETRTGWKSTTSFPKAKAGWITKATCKSFAGAATHLNVLSEKDN